MSNSSGIRFSTKVGSGIVTCTVAPDPLGWLLCAMSHVAPGPTSLLRGLRAATHHAVMCGSQASSIEKSLAGLPAQLYLLVPNARAQVFKVPNVWVILGLQDMWAGSAVNACKTYGHVATVQHQHC
jgi:hypothetical protein